MTSPAVASAPSALELRAVSVAFGAGVDAGLSALSLAVAAGERVALLGPSGAGKTTLLRAVAGLAPVRAGTVRVGGHDVTSLPPERRGAVYLHQTPVLFPHLSVADNVGFARRVRGASRAETADAVRRALAIVRLERQGARMPFGLSGGERHRVALARAIVARPAVLLLDEPLAALDPALRDEVREAIGVAQRESGAALVLVTHDLDDAGALADRVALLLDGTIAQVAAPAVVFTRPATLRAARFLGLFAELRGRRRADGAIEGAFGVLHLEAGTGALAPWARGGDGGDGDGDGDDVVAVAPRHALALRDMEAPRGLPGCPMIAGIVRHVRHGAAGAMVLVEAGDARLDVPLGAQRAPAPGDRVDVQVRTDLVTLFPGAAA